ncbi:unnamed protein product [Linum trigynum]|uniref:DUF599 domain-containing protein n=1 Tax=Linum trigynum TaxID=586398 RepID=A0AAV2DRI2_9ROSI
MASERVLDFTLVPLGLILMSCYHLWLLFRVLNHPSKTTIGVNSINRQFWARAMMAEPSKNGVLAVQTLRNNIMASTLLATTAIMLGSLIVVLLAGNPGARSVDGFVIGDRSRVGMAVKLFSLLLCFMVAFLMTVQSIRYYSHASFLINVPLTASHPHHLLRQQRQGSGSHLLTAEYVERSLNRGGYFWSLGLRAFYFSLPLFLWIFGPVPMFVSCLVLLLVLYFLDLNNEVEPGGPVTLGSNNV